MIKRILTILSLSVCCVANAQFISIPNQTANALVQTLVGGGISYSNATLVCGPNANAKFTNNATSLVGMDSGIVLTSGTTVGIGSSAATFLSAGTGTGGDAQLSALTGVTTFDVCKLEFDFIPVGDSIKFNYVFASDEYPTFACSSFGDVFGFFINGPGITGTVNMAVVPGTNIPITINSVNGSTSPNTFCTNMGTGSPFTMYYVNNAASTTIAYNGMTTMFTALSPVIPCSTYHLKLAIADGTDGSYDSGVFLKEGSLVSTPITSGTQGGSPNGIQGLTVPHPYAVRNCLAGTFKFQRPVATSSPHTIHFNIGGSAINGVDYIQIADSVVIPANQTQASVVINPVSPPTGTDSVILYLLNPYVCGGSAIIDSVKLWIYDSLQAHIVTNDTTICAGQSKQLIAFGDPLMAYSWAPPGTLNNPNIKNPIATPVTTTTYTLTVSLPGSSCPPVHDQVTITIPQLSGPPTSNSPVCAGQTLNLNAPGGLPPGTIYNWTGPNGWSSSAQNPVISPSSTLNAGTYTLSVTSGGCAFAPQTVAVVVNVAPVVAPTSNSPLCAGQTLNLFSNVTGTATYSWTGPAGWTSTLQNPTRGPMVPAWAGIYNLTVTQNGCTSNAAFTFVQVNPGLVTPTASNNGPVCVGGSITLTTPPVPGSTSYSWTGPNGFSQSGQTVTINPVTALHAGVYTVTASSANCTSAPSTTTVVVTPSPAVTGSSFTNPTGCNSSTGTITFNITPNGVYNPVTFLKNGVAQPSGSYTASGGILTIGNLGAGTYTDFVFTINGCSVTVPGPITLTDPAAPPAPTAGSNSPICAGQTINLTATNVAGATYTWTGPGFSQPQVGQNQTITSATTAMSGVYSVVATIGGCQSTPGTVNVVVNPVPTTPNASTSNSPVCTGSPLTLTGLPSTVGATWSWTGPNGFSANTQNATIASPTTLATGTYTVTAAVGNCVSQPYTLNVVVNQTPSISEVHQNPSACGAADGYITLTVTPGTGNYSVNYSKNSVVQPSIPGSGNTITIPNLTAGNYTNISVTQNGCTSNVIGQVLLVDPNAPATPTAANSGPVCAGQSATLTAGNTTPGAIYIWTATGFNDTGTSVTVPAVTTTTTFSLVANLNGCNSTPVNTVVAVTPAPAAPVTTVNSPLCEGDDIYLTAASTVGGTYYWSGPNGWTSNVQNPTIPTADPTMSGDYYVYTDGTAPCPSMTDTVTVVVNPIPASPVTVDIEACQYETVQLTAQGQNLLWYMAMTGGSGTNTMTANTQTAGVTVCYYVSQTINGCEGPRAPLCVYVKPQPAAPAATQNYVYCQYDPNATQLTATGTNLQWYDNNNTLLPGAPTPSTQVATTLTYYVTQTDSGCESNKTQIDVLINAKPPMPVVEQMTICQDEAAPVLNAAGQNLIWYDSATGGSAYAGTPVITTTDTGVFDYYVSQTVNGCESDRALLRVTVNPKVVAEFITDKDTVCDSYPLNITFTGLAPSTASYDWDFDSPTDVTGSGAGPYVVTWDSKGTKTITLTVTNLNCSSTVSKMVEVLETPDPMFAIQPDACLNEEVRVQSAYDQMDLPGYNWTFDGAQILSGSGYGPYTLKWTTTGQKVISMSLTNIPCPSLPYYDTINIHHPEAKVMDRSNSEICTSDSVLFTAQPGLDYQYGWSPKAWFGEETNSLSIWGVVKKGGYATLTVTDRWGCEASDSVLVEPKSCCEVFLPNTFTPNGDGKNDVFRMVTKGNQEISVFIIMDRWGKRMFESVNQYEGWDGSYNGEAQDMGTYQYYLRYRCSDNGEIVEMKGDVILLR